jgi:hypothetical protein
MRKFIFVFACITTVFAQRTQKQAPLNFVPSRTGLVLIGIGSDGVALATDSAQVNADDTTSQADRIFPIGKEGAVLIAGTTSIQDPLKRRVREELNISTIVAKWVGSHPETSLETADRALNDEISKAATEFFLSRAQALRSNRYEFEIISVGMSEGNPRLIQKHYTLPPTKARHVSDGTSAWPKPGEMCLAFVGGSV